MFLLIIVFIISEVKKKCSLIIQHKEKNLIKLKFLAFFISLVVQLDNLTTYGGKITH